MDADPSGAVRDTLETVARQIGEDQVADEDTRDLVTTLQRQGFEPYLDGDVVRLRNCPFHRLAREHTELVCGMNLAMLSGVLTRVDDDVEARLEPAPDRCCVAFVPA